jgi:DNA repair protein RecN (Recombination protein N)
MLTSLDVHHFAVVEAAEVTFGPGLTVISGETGAGKSLLVDALLLLGGARADAGMVRAGSNRAELAAEFDVTGLPEARAWLQAEELDEGDACQLRRVIRTEGSSKAWINGRPANARQLGELATLLVSIHGQHEHQALLSRAHQLDLLDAYGGHADLLERVQATARQWREAGSRMRGLGGGADRAQRIELLRHEIDELQQWALPTKELADLEASHTRLANAERLATGVAGIGEQIDGDSEFAVQRTLHRAHEELSRLAQLDRQLQPAAELLQSAAIQIEEANDQLGRYAQDVDLDPQRYEQVDDHLTHLHDLARRHRVAEDELPARREALCSELAALEEAGSELESLATRRVQLHAEHAAASKRLSAARTAAARRMETAVNTLLAELGMAGGRIVVELQALGGEEPDAQGAERCELLITTNPGQPPRPLRKVASGGELARISLAIEVATLGKNPTGSMILDEVDSGIGGAVAEVVGQKLRALGKRCQVLCVTHLPQVAAQGHQHLRVIKQTDGTTTHTHIETLGNKARGEELARMLGGIDITPETRAHARQMLASAQAD